MAAVQITKEEYLMGRIKEEDLPDEYKKNMEELLDKINKLLALYKKPVTLNSGYRSSEDQLRINPKAPKSKHTECAAIDLGDRSLSFRYWCLINLKELIDLGLYMEDPSHTPTWTHLQCIPPHSGSRIFLP